MINVLQSSDIEVRVKYLVFQWKKISLLLLTFLIRESASVSRD